MKKLLVIGLISSFFSAGAFAAACTATPASAPGGAKSTGAATGGTANTEECVCDGGLAVTSEVNGGKSAQMATAPIFLQSGFDVKCSANTIVSYNEVSPTAFAVASGSVKGNRTFKGSTAGGAIAEFESCDSPGCTGAKVSDANASATLDSSS